MHLTIKRCIFVTTNCVFLIYVLHVTQIFTTISSQFSSSSHRFLHIMNYSHLSTSEKSLKSSRALITPSENCSEIIFAAQNTFLPPVIIYSYPGSGNTWLRHLLQVTTGYWTGSLVFDKRLQRDRVVLQN